MKRILVALSVIGILCSLLLTGLSVFAEPAAKPIALAFTEKQMAYMDEYSAWGAEGDVTSGSWSNWGYVNQTVASIRKLVMPRAGTFKVETIWGTTGVTVQNAGDSFDFVILNNEKEIIWPAEGGWFTVTAETPAEVNLELAVAAGDAVYFVFKNGSTVPTPYTTAGVLCVDDYQTRLDNGSGGYGAADIAAQGNGGWYYLYATDVTDVTEADTAEKAVAFDFTEKPMDYIVTPDYSAWGVGEDITGGMWANWGYANQSYASIRKLVMPRAGTFKVETVWGTTGVTVQNAADSFDFAILNNDKEIVWPVTGGWYTVTASTPAEVNLELAVQAGDAVYFVFNNGSTVATPYTTAGVLCLDDYQTRLDDGNGGYGAADNSAQGNGGWYYLYATDLTAITADDYRDLTALNKALADAAAITDLSGYTADSVAAFEAAYQAAQAITEQNTQAEIDAAASALAAAINGLTLDIPEPSLPPEDPTDPTVALEFTELLMTYDTALGGWTADGDTNCVTYPWASVSPLMNQKVAIRKFVAPAAGNLILAWGNGVSVSKGSANFVITDEYGKILYPEGGGKVTLTAGEAHPLDTVFENVQAGDVFYFVVYNHTVGGAETTLHSAVNIDSVSYAENGNFASSANQQGANGWYYVYATDLKELKKSEYKSFVALNEQVALAQSVPETQLALFSEESVKAFTDALNAALALTDESAQEDIDAATAALAAAIKGLTPKATPAGVNKVTFTGKELTYNAALGYWSATEDPYAILNEPLNYPTPVTTSNLAIIRKLTLPADGTLLLKWGNGVYIDNTSGNYTGTSVEFAIADEDGNILYPQGGGVAVVKEGTPLVLDLELTVKKGEALYFITFNPSVANLPVVYNVGVTLNGTTALQTSGGFFYGSAHEQGSGGWSFLYADDLTFSAVNDGNQGGTGDGAGNDDSPATGDSVGTWAIVTAVILAGALLLLNKKHFMVKER
ncbi:MAG: FIVAR domain-containing protein [Clostridia bacterium]|nr:FIVAR domain-containing protein [Clostridia bacterium]